MQAAAEVGFVFCGRDRESLTPWTSPSAPDVEKHELLNVSEFTRERKRIGVVLGKLGRKDKRLFLTKGVDYVIFHFLWDSEGNLIVETETHLNKLANEGLRMLTLVYEIIAGVCVRLGSNTRLKYLDDFVEHDYQAWGERYHAGTVAMAEREAKIEAICTLEQNL